MLPVPAETPTGKADEPGVIDQGEKNPPRPRLALAVGVIGHRPKDLARLEADADPGKRSLLRKRRLRNIVRDVQAALDAIANAASRVQRDHGKDFDEKQPGPILTLVSALAEGADSIAARAALKRRFRLEAPLPFAAADYEKDFVHDPNDKDDPLPAGTANARTKKALAKFSRLLGRARRVLELPGERMPATGSTKEDARKRNRAYEAAGLTVISQADVVLAVWDGGLSRGRGGTAELITEAARAGLPIILVDARGERPIEIRWRNLMPLPAPVIAFEDLPAQSLSDGIHRVFAELVRLPAAPKQREAYEFWFKECAHSFNPYLAYPVLASMLLAPFIRCRDVHPPLPRELMQEDYLKPAAFILKNESSREIDWLGVPYGWSDAVASYFAQAFRSAFVMNFLFAALAVISASFSVMIFKPDEKYPLWSGSNAPVLIELFLIIFVVVIVSLGRGLRWHTRWVEARELAERMRTALPLWALGLRPAFFPGEEPTWTGWYARAVVRMQGLRTGRLTRGLEAERRLLLNVLTGQCDYNLKNAGRMRRLELGLEVAGLLLLAATGAVAFDHLFGGPTLHCALEWLLPAWMTADALPIWLSAAFPALATATYGIRVIGDFESAHQRAVRTHQVLVQLIKAVKEDPPDFALLRARARSAADAMLGDVSSWRLSAESRGLAIPG